MKLAELNVLLNTMLKTLETIHKLSVIHRDIKPDNFMFDESGRLTLIDFGLSTFYEKKLNEEKVVSFVGNLMYASPNVLFVSTTTTSHFVSNISTTSFLVSNTA
jgi:serine/threonine protein kinase